jgi:hypothetical protein
VGAVRPAGFAIEDDGGESGEDGGERAVVLAIFLDGEVEGDFGFFDGADALEGFGGGKAEEFFGFLEEGGVGEEVVSEDFGAEEGLVHEGGEHQEDKEAFGAMVAPSVGTLTAVATSESGEENGGQLGENLCNFDLIKRTDKREIINIFDQKLCAIVTEVLFEFERLRILVVDGLVVVGGTGFAGALFIADDEVGVAVQEGGGEADESGAGAEGGVAVEVAAGV